MNLKGDLIGQAPTLDRTGHMDPTEWERNDDDMPERQIDKCGEHLGSSLHPRLCK